MYGAWKSTRVQENLAQIEEFALRNNVLSCDLETARQYGRVKHYLQQKGRPLPENDIWIAALALQHDLRLITRDAHFQEIEGLKWISW